MKLKVLLPTKIFLEVETSKINAEGQNGSFGLLPDHIDFVTALVPSILVWETESGQENFLAIDEGILVKRGSEVLVSTRQAVRGTNLETLERTVREQFESLDERQKTTRTAIAKLEANFARRLLEQGRIS